MKRTITELQNEINKATMDLYKFFKAGNLSLHEWSEKDEKLKRDMMKEWLAELEVGDKGHICHWSDVTPCTIIKKTQKTLTVRHDDGELDPNWKPEWVPGGFSAICTNQNEQEWILKDDPDGVVEIFRWSDKYNCYRNKCGEILNPGWVKFYDYNF